MACDHHFSTKVFQKNVCQGCLGHSECKLVKLLNLIFIFNPRKVKLKTFNNYQLHISK